MPLTRLIRVLLLVVTVSVLSLSVACATTVSWKAAVSGNWSDGTKWSAGRPPKTTEDVVISVAGSGNYLVTMDQNASVHSITLGAATGTTTQTLYTAGYALTAAAASSVALKGVLQVDDESELDDLEPSQ